MPGIEVTAVWAGRDVHVLGYWIDGHRPAVAAFLSQQRARRVDAHPGDRRGAGPGRCAGGPGAAAHGRCSRARELSVGRPDIARLLVAAGHAASVQDAFDRWIAQGRPAYVPRTGVPPEAVVQIVHDAGGLASLAHPGVTRRDECLEAWAAAGLDAIEAYHSDHQPDDQARYVERGARRSGC